jgi:uncharacterized membrane protein
MNTLSKLQFLMVGFLVLVLLAFLINTLLLAPAILLFILQFPLVKGPLKKEYPEDWRKYAAVFLIYEIVLMALFYMMKTTYISFTNLSSLYNMFMAVIFVILMTVALKYFVGRKHCYGTVIFSTGDWVGVRIKGDLFSKINEANYAVENPLNVKVRKGDRVDIRIKGGLGKVVPYEIREVVK